MCDKAAYACLYLSQYRCFPCLWHFGFQEFLNYFERAANPPVPTLSLKFAVHLTEMASSVTVTVPENATMSQLKVAVAGSIGVHADDIELKLRNDDDKSSAPPVIIQCGDT